MIFKKTFLSGFIVALTALSSMAQGQLEKVKDKNLVGEWYSKDSISGISRKPVLTFYKNPTQGVKDSLATYFKINKNESLKIVKEKKPAPGRDTVMTTWLFVEGSKNLKITEKIKTAGTMTYKAADGSQSAGNYFITKTSTFHIEFISEDKMVMRYVNY